MAGVFTPSQLLALRAKAETFWTDGAFNLQYTPKANSAIAVLKNQTATFKELKDPEKDKKIGITWIDPCAITVQDCTTDCTLEFAEVDTKIKEYELLMCKEVGFSIDATKLRTNDYELEQVFARNLAMAIKKLDEWWAVQVLLKTKTFADINVYPDPYTFDAVNKTTKVPAAQYNLVDLVANVINQAELNEFASPYFIEAGGLRVDAIKADLNKGNADGSGEYTAANALNLTYDPINFLKAGLSEDLFMIDQSAIAFVTKARHKSAPAVIGGQVQQTVYTVPSKAYGAYGVNYDVFYGLTCKDVDGEAHYIHTWKIKTRGDVFINPTKCPVTIGGTVYSPNGVISYTKTV